MTVSRAASVGQAFQSWATTLGIIIAGVWAVYTFIYKEIIIPETSPINVSVNLSIKEAGTASNNPTGSDLSAVEVALTASNPSARTVYILGGAFGIYGQRMTMTSSEESDKFNDAVRADVSTSGGYYAEKYANASTAELLAGGQPIEDFALRPGESARRSLIVHFPRKTYDQLEVRVYIPTVGSLEGRKEVKVKWSLSDLRKFTVYRNDNGKESMIQNPIEDKFLDSVGFQVFTTSAQLSLWHGESGR